MYDITPRSAAARAQLLGDTSPSGAAVVKSLRPKAGGWTIDVVIAASEKWPREKLAAQLNRWELDGLIDVKASQVRVVSADVERRDRKPLVTFCGTLAFPCLEGASEGLSCARGNSRRDVQ